MERIPRSASRIKGGLKSKEELWDQTTFAFLLCCSDAILTAGIRCYSCGRQPQIDTELDLSQDEVV